MLATASLSDTRRAIADARKHGRTIGFVPTMGALHAGHKSLMDQCRSECGFSVASIFVNPTQFGPNEDFTRYPRTLETDLALCEKAGCDLVFHPETSSLYPPGFCSFVDVSGISERWEGAHRPGHFRGVATIVMKLFQIVQPDVAFFGQKDYQQQLLIRTMCRDLDVPVEVRTCPTIREPDGLALSSRNRYLNVEERKTALTLSRSLRLAHQLLAAGERNIPGVVAAMRAALEQSDSIQLDYATIVDPETLTQLIEPQRSMVALVAAKVGKTRLIDNILIDLA